jgi:regulatory protein YycH of two-component signal transduction system YycFG
VLASLFYAYYDMVGRELPTGYLSVGLKDRSSHHGCVLIKERDDRVAIIDWGPITVEDGKITFLPFKEAKMLHERYWNSSISYDGVQWWAHSDPFIVRNFSSEEEFYKWLIEEFN